MLLQSTRGTGGSGGDFHFWRNDAADGQATVEWLRKQEWFSGDLFTVGASGMTYTQAALALDPPPEWRAAVMRVGHTDPAGFFWQGGAFGLERALVGGLALFNQAMTTRDYARTILRMTLRLRGVPLFDAYPSLFGGRRQAFEDWLSHPAADDPFWAGSDYSAVDTFPAAVSLSTGWWDLVPEQVIAQYHRLRATGRDVDLLIGPWTHTSALEDGWAELFAQAMRRLRGEPPAYRVRVHVGGAGGWRDLDEWPPPGAREQRLQLGPGTLRATAGEGATTFRYDPSDPTPSIGGALQSRTQGQRDNAPLERRTDVVTFTGEPLTGAVEVLGTVRAEFDAESTARSADLFARLCDVDPEGRSVNVCDGLARMTGTGRTVVTTAPTAHRFRPGHRIRLLVAGGAHPRWLRNYGTGEPPGPATRMVATDTTVRHTSALVLPVVQR